MSIIITKAKLLKDDKVEVSYTRQSTKHKPSLCTEEHRDPPHADLTNSFSALAVHAAIIAEFINEDDIRDIETPDHPQLEKFTVTGISIQGEDEGIVLTAMKTLRSGKKMLFNCPLIRFEDASDTAYPHSEELLNLVNNARTEVKRYLEGHYAEDAQTSIPFPENEKITHMQVLEPEDEMFPAIKRADPDAMKRVADMDKPPKRKRTRQTAEVPSGIAEETE